MYQVTGNRWHEIIGIILFLFFVIHCALNGYWFMHYKKIAQSTKNDKFNRLNFLIDNVIIINMSILAITSVFISRDVVVIFPFSGGEMMNQVHVFSAYTGLILLAVHLGCHLRIMFQAICVKTGKRMEYKKIALGSHICMVIMIVAAIYFSFLRLKEWERGEQESNTNASITQEDGEKESLESYLGILVCTGCGRGCLLIAPQCGKGRVQAKEATNIYNATQ